MVAGDERSLILKKVEPWNSVRVTFNIPADAAERLRELAQHPNSVLRELGVLAVQIAGDDVMSLSVCGNASNTDTKPSDVVAGSGSQAVCQPTASVVASDSGKASSQPTDPSFHQFKVPTFIVPSCCPTVLPPASGAVRTIVADHPVPEVVSNFSVAQPRPVGLVRWPNVVPGCPGLDAVAVRFAVPPVPMKEFSQGLCFISPVRAAVSQNIASSSPLLVNLLQTRRQQGITAVPSQPFMPLDATASVILPQKRRRNTSARKAKQSRNDHEAVIPVTSLRLTADGTLHAAQTPISPVTATFAAGSRTTLTSDNRTPTDNEKISEESLIEGVGRARRMINPYTGNLELVDVAEDDGLSMSVYSSTEISDSCSSIRPLSETAVTKSTALLNSDQYLTGSSNQSLPSFVPSKLISAAVKASEFGTRAASGNLLAKNEDIACTANPTVSTSLVSISTLSTPSRYVDWYTASQSDKHNRLQCDTAQLLFTGGLSGVKQPQVVEGVKLSNITVPSENLGVGSNTMKAGTYSCDERLLSATKSLCANGQPAVSSLSRASTVAVRQKSVSDGIPPQSSNFSTSCSTVPQLSTSQTDLIQMAFTLAKQNGTALHVSSLVDNLSKNAGLLQTSLQSLNIALATTSNHSSSAATTTSSCAQSKVKDVDGVASTTTVVLPDACFFPAVSCFPPEHRRKSAVSIGGFGINPEPHLQTGTSAAVSSLVSTLPTVKLLTSTSMPLEVMTCGMSVVPSTVSNPITINSSVTAESNLLSVGAERAQLLSSEVKKSIPLLTNLAPTSWPLMPNLLTVPLVNPTPLPGSPLLHCVTRAPLTPSKLAGLSAAVTNVKSSIVPLAGRFCIPLTVTASADKQNVESTVVSGNRPHAIMLTDNLTKFKLSVSSNSSKSSGKHSSSKDRRGTTTRTDDSTVQRGSGKSHLTVAQLLDMAKNARLQQTACDDDQIKTSEQQSEPSSSVATSLQPQSALTISPLQLPSLPLQSNSVLLASHDQLVSVRLPSSATVSIHSSPSPSALMQTNANPVLSLSSTSSVVVTQSSATAVSTVSSHLLTQPLNPITNFSTVSKTHLATNAADVPGKVAVDSATSSEYLALNTFSSSASVSLPMPAYSVQPPLPITSPRYPLNLTESVKKAMRGVGLYPSPPVSPTTPLQTFGSLKLPEIRPYPASIACSVSVTEFSAKKLMQARSTVTAPVVSQPQLSTASSCAAVSWINSCGLLSASVNSTSCLAATTANNCASFVSHTTVCAEMTEKQLTVKNGEIVSHSDCSDVHVVPAVTSIDSAAVTDSILTCDSLPILSQSGAIQPESTTTECSAYVSTVGADVICNASKSELLSSMLTENSGLQGDAGSSHNSLKDGLCVTKTINCVNGGLSASSGDSDMELRRDMLEGLSSVETDAGLSSLQSSPCSTELANVLYSTKETNIAVANNTEVMNCISAVDRWHSHDADLSNAWLSLDSPVCEGSLSLHCDTTVEATPLASDSPTASVDVKGNEEAAKAPDAVAVPSQKVAADSSVTSSKYSLLKRNRLETALSNISIRSMTRRKRPADIDTNSDVVSDTSNNVEPGEQRTKTSVGSVTRMTTRSSRRTAVSITGLANKTGSGQTKCVVQKTLVKSPEKRGRAALESTNHEPDLSTKSVLVTQRRSFRTPVAKVVDKSESVTMSQDTDSGISLRTRRHAQKTNSIEVVTPRKRSGLRGTGESKDVLCLVDSTENVIGVLDGAAGIEVNMNDHEDSR